jgi:hypothetical protein
MDAWLVLRGLAHYKCAFTLSDKKASSRNVSWLVSIYFPPEAGANRVSVKPHSAIVLLLADRRHSQTAKVLKTSGCRLMMTFTPDHAVAICVNNPVDAVILDQAHFVQTEGWSVAQSLKMIRNNVCVVLVVHGKIMGKRMPEGVDAVVPENDPDALIATLKDLLKGF